MAHKVFLGFAFLTNLLVTQMLLLGGAAAVHQFTGMHVWAAAALIPVGVIIYTMMGGLRYLTTTIVVALFISAFMTGMDINRAAFLAAYMNTAFVFVLLLVITFTLYLTDNVLGGPSGIYDRLAAVTAHTPVIGNAGGSYLTMASLEGGTPGPLPCP
jgi:Na+/proline symporter